MAGLPQAASAFEIFGFKFFEDEEDVEPILEPVDYTVTLAVSPAVAGLEEELRDASILVADEDEPVSGSLGLIAKARDDRKRLVATLFENARYGGLVYIFIEGRKLSELPPDATFDTSRPVPIQIRVDPGRQFAIGEVAVSADGADVDPAAYGLTPGSSASSVRILDAESELLRDLRNDGRPFVAVTERDVIADHNTALVDYRLGVSPGQPVPFGTTYVAGAKAVDPGFIAYMADIQRGETFSPEALDDARKRLVELGVFSSVTVREAKAQAPDGTLPVQIEVGERKFNYFGIGATYSNTDGAGVSGYIGNRNLFGRAESIRLDASVSRIGATAITDAARETDELDYEATLVFKKPGVLGPDSVYIGSIEALSEHPLAYDRRTFAATSGVEYEIDDDQTLAAAVRGEYEEITDFLGTRDYLLASVPSTYTFDDRDDELNPTEGLFAKLYLEPTYGFENGSLFLKSRIDASTYLSFGETDRFVLAGRAAYGTIFGADLLDIPNDRRFYAGGGGSVRGYAYQSIGPYFPSEAGPGENEDFEDTPTGGLSLFEASVEARIGVTDNIQIVPFLDMGTVSDDLVPDFSNFKLGAGVGARYVTSFGPIRVDVGFPLDPGPRDASYQIYAGIGQAF